MLGLAVGSYRWSIDNEVDVVAARPPYFPRPTNPYCERLGDHLGLLRVNGDFVTALL